MAIFYHQDPNPYLMASSLLFWIPLQEAIRRGRRWTVYTLSLLIPASLAFHATKHPALYALDQAAVYALVACSWYDGYHGDALLITTTVNAASFYLYMWGRLSQSLIWSADFQEATAAHILMHALSALGYTWLLKEYKQGL
jgi:hypothetical protein